tara:strand:- start:625 stop:1356 length:732 start_codon:yes stop_codon:yes gene_type:complete
MAFFRSALVVLLIVLATSCTHREKLDGGDRSKFFSTDPQTKEHFEFIDHTIHPAVGSLYNTNNSFVGSCVLIKEDVALTAGHCIELGDLKYIRFGNEEILIKHQYIHKDYGTGDDLGILLLDSPSQHNPMSIMTDVENLPKMYPITTIAHGGGNKKISKERVFRYYGILKNKPNEVVFLPLHSTIWFGDSGGALVYKSITGEYQLMGILTHFSMVDQRIYECAARRVDNINVYDDIWQPWIPK